jgi:hypothetical protein
VPDLIVVLRFQAQAGNRARDFPAEIEPKGGDEHMHHTTTRMTSRRAIFSRLMATAIAAPLLSIGLSSTTHAKKKGKNTIATVKDRIASQEYYCTGLGGQLSTTTLPSGTKTTSCQGGSMDGTYCKHTSKETTCRCNNTGQDGWCS